MSTDSKSSLFLQLMESEDAKKAVSQLQKYGLNEAHIIPMIRHFSILPDLWQRFSDESPQERNERRNKVAASTRELAIMIQNDPEFCHWSILDHESISDHGWSNRPSIHGFLQELSKNFESHSNYKDWDNELVPPQRPTRNKLSEFVQRNIAEMLNEILGNPDTKPIAATKLLTNAVLGSDTVSEESIKQVYRRIKKKGND